MNTLLTNCTIFTHPGVELLHNGYIAIKGQNIDTIGTMNQMPDFPDAKVVDCQGKLVMPGLINGHNHCAMTLFRGLADDLKLSEWLHGHIFPAEKKCVSPEMVYWCSRLAVAEMLLSGTTTVADAYFFSHESARAISDCGMRAVIGHGTLDFPTPSVPDPKKNVEAAALFVDSWNGKNPLITPAVFAHAPYTCSPATLTKTKELANKRGVRFFTHIAESKQEPEMIINLQDKTPLKHLNALGLLDENSVLVHAVWLDDDDVDIIARSGAHVVTCPQSNAKLASGIANITDMLEKNITVGLGTDGCASNNSLDMFREMDSLAKIHKLKGLDATALPAQQVIATATTANAELLGLPGLGTLAAGNPADLIILDLQAPNLTPFYSPDLLVYSGCGSNVENVMINGQMVVENREILSFDLQETLFRIRELATQHQSL